MDYGRVGLKNRWRKTFVLKVEPIFLLLRFLRLLTYILIEQFQVIYKFATGAFETNTESLKPLCNLSIIFKMNSEIHSALKFPP